MQEPGPHQNATAARPPSADGAERRRFTREAVHDPPGLLARLGHRRPVLGKSPVPYGHGGVTRRRGRVQAPEVDRVADHLDASGVL
ncbi:hypothetical protein ACFRKB_21505 [Streptomyces scopuliridis]|uniref:hypothetical protein n=1 Tax=Streptomyces scopuliridis TaxID=452529 RepID=UPI00367EE5CC